MRRELVNYAREQHGASWQMACRAVGISKSVYRYQPDTNRDEPVYRSCRRQLSVTPAYGFSMLFNILKRWCHPLSHKPIYQLYCELSLNKRRRNKMRLPSRNPVPLAVPATLNQSWSIGFMSGSLFCGHRFTTFNVVDDFNRRHWQSKLIWACHHSA